MLLVTMGAVGVFSQPVAVGLALLEPGSILSGLLLSPIAGLPDRCGYSGAIEKGRWCSWAPSL